MIRPACADDIPEIARLGALFHARAGWDEIEYREEDCAKSLEVYMGLPAFICLVADVGRLAGMIAGVTSPVYFNHAHRSGEELFWWVADDAPQMTGIRLLKALEEAGRAQGCATWQMKSLDRLEGGRVGALLERHDYRRSEQLFIKVL